MKTVKAEVGGRYVDSLQFSQGGTPAQALALKNSGIDGVFGYLGAINATRLKAVLDAGMSFMPVTFAANYDGKSAVANMKALGLTAGVTVWLDLEGLASTQMPTAVLIAKINQWAVDVIAGGYEPGLYVGAPQPLTSLELYHLKVVRYWDSLSREADRNGALAEPACGWCCFQMFPSRLWRSTGVFVDVNMIGQDYQGRVPSCVVA